MMRLLPTFLSLMFASSQAVSSPTFFCTNDEGVGYHDIKGMARGFTIYHSWEAVHLVHCPAGRMVKASRSAEASDLDRARYIVVEMLADGVDQTMDDVVRRLENAKFNAVHQAVESDGCICDVEPLY